MASQFFGNPQMTWERILGYYDQAIDMDAARHQVATTSMSRARQTVHAAG